MHLITAARLPFHSISSQNPCAWWSAFLEMSKSLKLPGRDADGNHDDSVTAVRRRSSDRSTSISPLRTAFKESSFDTSNLRGP